MTTDETPPWETDEGGFSITLKAGKGYEDSWFNIRDNTATGLKQRIAAAFGMDMAAVEELSLVALINNATQEFHALGNVAREFPGARAVSSGRSGRRTTSRDEVDASAQAEQEDPNAGLLALVEAATTVDELKRFWVQHNPLAPDVEAAWRAKGKALKGEN